MKLSRINRLFNPKSGKCFDVAIDHGFFNELTFLGGIENIQKSVQILIDADPDAIQLTVGQAQLVGQGEPPGGKLAASLYEEIVELALANCARVHEAVRDRLPPYDGTTASAWHARLADLPAAP